MAEYGGSLTENECDLKRLGLMKSERVSWVPQWMESSNYTLPRSGRFFIQDRNRGSKRYNNIYDNTATRALRVLQAGLMGGATSPARPWFRYGVSDPDLAKSPAVKEWCAIATQMTLDVFAKSNTYRMLQSIYQETGLFGTGCSIFMDDFKNVINHYNSTCGEYMIAQDYRGQVDTVVREFEKPVMALVGEFGYKNCSMNVQQAYDRGNYDQWFPVIHIIAPRTDRDPTKFDAKNMAWKSNYFEPSESGTDKMLRSGGSKTFKALCPRWDIVGGDIYGSTCPGMESLGDNKQLQHQQLRKGQGIDYQTQPPLQGPTSMKNQPSSRFPGGFAFHDSSGPGGGIRTQFETNLNLQYLLDDIKDVRNRIENAYYTDLFLMLSQDASDNDERMTATQVGEMHEEKLLMLGPVLERMHNELFSPLVEMTFTRMLEAKILPPPPPELHGANLNVEFVSMLAQAQRAVETNSVDRFVTSMGTLVQIGVTSVVDKFDSDKWADKYSDLLGIDPDLIVGDDKVAMIRQQRAKRQQQAQAGAAAEQNSKTAKNLAQAPTTGGNALTDVTSNFSGYSTPSVVQ